MSLRSQLEELLPELLPSDPAQAIKGTELIRLVRLRLGEEYSDASLRYHFSFMASGAGFGNRQGGTRPGLLQAHEGTGRAARSQRAFAPVPRGKTNRTP